MSGQFNTIAERDIRVIWARLGPRPREVWICPGRGRPELRIVGTEPWVPGALMVGKYTAAVLLSDFTDDVRVAEAEFEGVC